MANYGTSNEIPSNDANDAEIGIVSKEEVITTSSSSNSYYVGGVVGISCIVALGLLVSSDKIPSIRSAASKTTSLLQKSESLYAPLALQEVTHMNFIPTLLEKYGMVGTDDATGQYTSFDDVTKGWAYVEVYRGEECSSTEYVKGGMVTGQCLPVYGFDDVDYEESILFQCDSGSVYQHKFNGSDCSQLLSTTKIASEGCKKRTSDSAGTYYHNMQCVSGGGLPVVGSYALFKGYIDQDPGVCKNAVLFEASKVDTCMPLKNDDEEHSVQFTYFNKEASVSLWYNSDSCSGKAADADLASDCTEVSKSNPEFPLDAELSYTWEYYDSKETM